MAPEISYQEHCDFYLHQIESGRAFAAESRRFGLPDQLPTIFGETAPDLDVAAKHIHDLLTKKYVYHFYRDIMALQRHVADGISTQLQAFTGLADLGQFGSKQLSQTVTQKMNY